MKNNLTFGNGGSFFLLRSDYFQHEQKHLNVAIHFFGTFKIPCDVLFVNVCSRTTSWFTPSQRVVSITWQVFKPFKTSSGCRREHSWYYMSIYSGYDNESILNYTLEHLGGTNTPSTGLKVPCSWNLLN